VPELQKENETAFREERGFSRKANERRFAVSFANWEYEQEVKRKKAAGWKFNSNGILLPPQPRGERNRQGNLRPSGSKTQRGRLDIPKTSDPDYYADSLLDEIKAVHDSVIDCFRDLKERLIAIENKMAKKRSVKHT